MIRLKFVIVGGMFLRAWSAGQRRQGQRGLPRACFGMRVAEEEEEAAGMYCTMIWTHLLLSRSAF